MGVACVVASANAAESKNSRVDTAQAGGLRAVFAAAERRLEISAASLAVGEYRCSSSPTV
jgi:hypothetical protein